MKWLHRILGALAAAAAIFSAVLLAGRARDRRELAARETELEREVSAQTHAARVHRERARDYKKAAENASRAVTEKLQKVAEADDGDDMAELLTNFNAERRKRP